MLDGQRLVQLMQAHQVANERDLVGVCDKEIQALERRLGLSFPDSYKQFLHLCGRSAGHISPWVALYFDDLMEIREEFFERLAQAALPLNLSSDVLIIAQAEEVFDFLYCDGSDDPPVYRINFQAQPPTLMCQAQAYSLYLEAVVIASDRDNWLDDLADDDTYAVADLSGEDDKLAE